MAISQRTAHKHLQRIYRKLHLGNRTSLIVLVHHISDINLPATGKRASACPVTWTPATFLSGASSEPFQR
jgi:hypothetical protein